jgi:hypothetical protein
MKLLLAIALLVLLAAFYEYYRPTVEWAWSAQSAETRP